MVQQHEWMFYEVMWRNETSGRTIPLPWWVQQYFRHWMDAYDGGLFDSKEGAFSSNANYRYWNMVGVKDHKQESLVGQSGEIEPVYDQYCLGFFIYDPETRKIYTPQYPKFTGTIIPLEQQMEDNYLPIIITKYRPHELELTLEEKVIATTVGPDQRSMLLIRLNVDLTSVNDVNAWFCLSISPAGPTGFQRHDRAGRYIADRRITFMKYLTAETRVLINASWGPIFDKAPDYFGTYGNGDSYTPDHYINHNPYKDLITNGELNGFDAASDNIAGLCNGVFAWQMNLSSDNQKFLLDVRLPVDDYRGPKDLDNIKKVNADTLEADNRTFWKNKLDSNGLQATLPKKVKHLFDLFRICRSNLLILSDNGEIHPGPTIYDSFWIRDSAVEGIACALIGDKNLAQRQFGHHYPAAFNRGYGNIGPASEYGFFGGEHEKNDREWDSNGQALWAISRFDRINAGNFGAGLFSPYIIEGARWIRNNRDAFGILHSGWSAEHLGDKGNPHYWDDFWGLAGLWEAARLAERIRAPEAGEIWQAYNDLNKATTDSIRWVLTEQASRGCWETFIPTGPGDIGRLDSTMIGILSYFHPCRLYFDSKLGADIDQAARYTLETIWSHFVNGGFRHDSAWFAYGPYLTLQLAHAYLLIGDLQRMDQCLAWTVDAGYAKIDRYNGVHKDQWQVVTGAWNEQHCYPIADNFKEFPERCWYMGDIPHGWACAEFVLLLRDILFFEVDEDNSPSIYIAPGVMPHWLENGDKIGVSNAPTIFGTDFGYTLSLDKEPKKVTIEITQTPPANVGFIYPCRFGNGVHSASANGNIVNTSGKDVYLPAGTTKAVITYI